MITKNKINRQAKALLKLYKTLPKKTRMEIKKMRLEDEISFEENDTNEALPVFTIPTDFLISASVSV